MYLKLVNLRDIGTRADIEPSSFIPSQRHLYFTGSKQFQDAFGMSLILVCTQSCSCLLLPSWCWVLDFTHIFISGAHLVRSLGRNCEDIWNSMEQQVVAIHQQVLKQTNKILFSSDTQTKNLCNSGMYPLLSFSLATVDFTI